MHHLFVIGYNIYIPVPSNTEQQRIYIYTYIAKCFWGVLWVVIWSLRCVVGRFKDQTAKERWVRPDKRYQLGDVRRIGTKWRSGIACRRKGPWLVNNADEGATTFHPRIT